VYDQITSESTRLLLELAATLDSCGIAASDESAAGFLEFILTRDPKERPAIDQVIERKEYKDNSGRGIVIPLFLIIL
jgi:hypothetical protein